MAYKTRNKIKTTSFTEEDDILIKKVIKGLGEKSYSDYANRVIMNQIRKDEKKLNK